MNSSTWLLWIAAAGALTICAACGTAQPLPAPDSEFEFSSGGAYHFEGFGEWSVRLNAAGAFSVKHDVRGEITDFGTYMLPDEKNAELWALVEAAKIGSLRSSTRAGVPDEVQYTFVLREGRREHTVEIWINDAREKEEIVRLVTRIAALIETYTGEKAVLN